VSRSLCGLPERARASTSRYLLNVFDSRRVAVVVLVDELLVGQRIVRHHAELAARDDGPQVASQVVRNAEAYQLLEFLGAQNRNATTILVECAPTPAVNRDAISNALSCGSRSIVPWSCRRAIAVVVPSWLAAAS